MLERSEQMQNSIPFVVLNQSKEINDVIHYGRHDNVRNQRVSIFQNHSHCTASSLFSHPLLLFNFSLPGSAVPPRERFLGLRL